MDDLGAVLEQTLRDTRAAFPELEFLVPDGTLDIPLAGAAVERIRIELAAPQCLHLQAIGLTTEAGLSPADLAAAAHISVSSWYQNREATFDPVALFDVETPGTAFHTVVDPVPWIEIAFDEPVVVTDIRLVNVANRHAIRARSIRVLVAETGGPLTVVHDADRRMDELHATLTAALGPDSGADAELTALLPIVHQTILGDYTRARTMLKAATTLSDGARRAFRESVNRAILLDRSVEWTAHGALRSFRFWSPQEKRSYVEFAVSVVEDLATLTPHVAFGFGSVLAAVRDRDLIPHDDDLDLVIAFDPSEAATLPEALTRVEDFLRDRAYTVSGDFFAHRHVGAPGRKKVDVFVGLFEGDTVSWYPGPRGVLQRAAMFPTRYIDLLGVACPVPGDPETYLASLYGPTWRTPDPGFAHSWVKKPFVDQATSAPVTTVAPPEPVERRRRWRRRP